MKIGNNTIYHLPTQAHEDDFLKQADKIRLRWLGTNSRADVEHHWNSYGEETCIKVNINNLLTFGTRDCYVSNNFKNVPIIEWKIGFTKADMQIGQLHLTKGGNVYKWSASDIVNYTDDLKYTSDNSRGLNDIVEVYPLNLTPIWKREEPKYRVKTELTKEQAEKLGLEFCEEVE